MHKLYFDYSFRQLLSRTNHMLKKGKLTYFDMWNRAKKSPNFQIQCFYNRTSGVNSVLLSGPGVKKFWRITICPQKAVKGWKDHKMIAIIFSSFVTLKCFAPQPHLSFISLRYTCLLCLSHQLVFTFGSWQQQPQEGTSESFFLWRHLVGIFCWTIESLLPTLH